MTNDRWMAGLTTLVAVAATCPAQEYVLRELSGGAGNSRAYGINSTGQAVGWVDAGEVRHGAHWLNDTFSDLHGTVHLNLDQVFTVGWSEVYGISNGDQMVGIGRTVIKCPDREITESHGMLLQPAVNSDLGTPIPGDALTSMWTFGNPCAVFDSSATDISNANHLVGWSDLDAGGAIRAIIIVPVGGRWFVNDIDPNVPVNDIMINLGTLSTAGGASSASGVNDSGWVVGYSYTSQAEYHAFLVQPNGNLWFDDQDNDTLNDLMIDLGTLGGSNSWARGVNNNGQIVGESDTADFKTHAFVWENGVMTDLGTLGGDNSSAGRVSDSGLIVGWAENAAGDRRACVWINGVAHDLNDMLIATAKPAGALTEARDVNENGYVVGWTTSSAGVDRGFLLRPATQAEINAANAAVDDNVDAGNDDEPDTDDNGVPVPASGDSTGVPLVDGQTDAAGDDADDGGTAGPAALPALCGAGFTGAMLPLLFGLAALRVRR